MLKVFLIVMGNVEDGGEKRTEEKSKQEGYFNILGKSFVGDVRGVDYAHAGELEAIEILIKEFPDGSYLKKRDEIKVLDVGCGTGGTAEYYRKKVFGNRVYACDIDGDSIIIAKKTYPEVNFFVADAHKLHKETSQKFDIFTMMNVFYEISDQKECLRSINRVSNRGAILAIFDYTNIVGDKCSQLEKGCIPMEIEKIDGELLSQSGWKMVKFVDLSAEYERWYVNFLNNMKMKKEELVRRYSAGIYNAYWFSFSSLLHSIKTKELGGGILYCVRE